eukprot:5351520-Lingulodinium_polyedra.AAC.1
MAHRQLVVVARFVAGMGVCRAVSGRPSVPSTNLARPGVVTPRRGRGDHYLLQQHHSARAASRPFAWRAGPSARA